MIKVEIPLADVIIDPADPPALAEMPRAEAERLIGEAYAFLPGPLAVAVAGDVATITSPAESRSSRKTRRLLATAATQIDRDNDERAAQLLTRLLGQAPDHVDARRGLGIAYGNLGQMDAAEAELKAAVNLAPGDAYAFILLGDLYFQAHEDADAAERLYARAIAAKPDDPQVLTDIATAFIERAQPEKAHRYFDMALAADPANPMALLGKALSFNMQDDTAASMNALDALYEALEAVEFGTSPLFGEAWVLYLELSSRIAERDHDAAMAYVVDWRDRLVGEGGVAIELIEDPDIGDEFETAIAWHEPDRTRHEVRYQGKSREAIPHHIAHGLQAIVLEMEARAAGRGRVFRTTPEIRADAARAVEADVEAMRREGTLGAAHDLFMETVIYGMANMIYTLPLTFVIESRLYREHPALRAVQVVSLGARLQRNENLIEYPRFQEILPRLVFNVEVAMNAALAFFVDDLFGGVTGYSLSYKGTPFYREGRRLFKIWQDIEREYRPGDEYELVDRFAAALRLQRWYKWG